MSKATILANLGAGLYQVDIIPDTAYLDYRVYILGVRRDVINSISLPAAVTRQTDATTAHAASETAEATAITQYNADTITLAALQAVHITTLTTGLALRTARINRQALAAQLESIKREIAFLGAQKVALTRRTEAWCADASFGLAGADVGVIDMDGDAEITGRVLLRPNLATSATFDEARDGRNVPAVSQTPASTFYNWAMRDGWQRWLPQYRLATITFIDYATGLCEITLVEVLSRDQRKSINVITDFEGVPVTYSTCGADAFRSGDIVVVEFADRSYASPRIIGFRDNPRKCGFRIRIDYQTPGAGIAPGAPSAQLQLRSHIAPYSVLETISTGDSARMPWVPGVAEFIITRDGDWTSVLVEARLDRSVRTMYPGNFTPSTLLASATPIAAGSAPVSMLVEQTIPHDGIDIITPSLFFPPALPGQIHQWDVRRDGVWEVVFNTVFWPAPDGDLYEVVLSG